MPLHGATDSPSQHGRRLFAQSGAICSYGPQLEAVYRRVGSLIVRILAGASAPSLPIERPTQFELVINRKTAKAMGLTIPQSLLLRADEVIE